MARLRMKLVADREIIRKKTALLQARIAEQDAKERKRKLRDELKQLQPKKASPAE